MNVSVLLRLRREQLAAGRLVGEAEVVETGERTVVRSTRELVGYLRARAEPTDGCADGGETKREPAATQPKEEAR